MKINELLCYAMTSIAVVASGAANATLIGRDLDGDLATFEAYYDTDLNVTWLADANVNGAMTWAQANAWATTLSFVDAVNNITYNDWRLPTVNSTSICVFSYSGGTDCGYNVNPDNGEMAHLFYTELGNLAPFDTNGVSRAGSMGIDWGLVNSGPFVNLQPTSYWYGTQVVGDDGAAWYFAFSSGGQGTDGKTATLLAMAVRTGDVTTVPAPSAIWLLLSGVLGVLSYARKK